MEIKIEIDKDTIDANVETSISADNIIVSGRSFSTPHAGLYFGFLKKIIPIVTHRDSIEYKQTVSDTGEVIDWIDIHSNTGMSAVFDIFRSMGIYMSKLHLGVNMNSHTLYTSSKLCRDLNKYGDSQKAAVAMYLLTLSHFILTSEEKMVKYTYDGCTNALTLMGTATEHFIDCLRKFTVSETWYIKDTNDDRYASVKYFNTDNVNVLDAYGNGDSVKIGVVKRTGGSSAGVASVKLGALAYTFIVTDREIYTDFDICNMEMGMDSVCAYIANAFGKTVVLKKVSELPLNKDMEFLDFEEDDSKDLLISEKVPATVVSWFVRSVAKKATVASLEDFEYLNKKYGVSLPKSSTATAISCEDMKKLYATDSYAQELYKQIKPYYETYVLGPELDANVKGFSNGTLYSMAFVGESGTGKSTAARVLPAKCGIPYVSINFSVNIEEADLFGSMVPNAKKSKPEDPEFVWADGIITKAVRNGYCVILEELNFARPGVLGKLNSLLDENRQIDLSTGEIVRAHQNFRIIATCNIAYEGTNRFNKALINRFDDVTIFKDLSRADAITVIKNRTGYRNTSKISKIYDVYEALKKFASEQNVSAVVSMRQLLNIFTKGKCYSSAKDAVQRIMVNGAFIEDYEYQKVFEETVLTAFDLKFKI